MGIATKSGVASRALLIAFCGFAVPAWAQTPSVILTWNPNPEPFVAGYIVFVGNASRNYHEQHDVGNDTSFVYPNPVSGRPYYFAVAAYAEGQTPGPRSQEVFFLGGSTRGEASALLAVPSEQPHSVPRTRLCTDSAAPTCYSREDVANIPGDASSMAPTGDGRLFFIQDGTTVRVIVNGALISQPALTRDSPASTLAGFVLDPGFAGNRFAYTAEVTAIADGRRTLSIVRYRELGNVLAERAVLVDGLAIGPTGAATLTIDSAQRLYTALPGLQGRGADAYSGMVLRFEADGSVSRSSRAGSPVLARGYAQPASLSWNDARSELWLTGAGADWADGPVARLVVDTASTEWPRVPHGVALRASSASSSTMDDADVMVVDKDRGLLRIRSTPEGMLADAISRDGLGGTPTSAALDAGIVYVSVRVAAHDAAATSQIVRLRRD